MRCRAMHLSSKWAASLLVVGANAFSPDYHRGWQPTKMLGAKFIALRILKEENAFILHSNYDDNNFNYYGGDDDANQNNNNEGGEEENTEGENIWYDDFGDFVIGDNGNDSFSGAASNTYNSPSLVDESLQQRIRQQQQQELQRETRLLQNWKQGDWSVRGFSLDPTDAINEAVAENYYQNLHEQQQQQQKEVAPPNTPPPIYISKVVPDANSEGQRVWVGRSNGSLVWVKLGTEATTHFTSKIRGRFTQGGGIDPTAATNSDSDVGEYKDDDDDSPSSMSVQFSSELVRDPNSYPSLGGGDSGPTNLNNNDFYDDPRQQQQQPQDPFRVLAQFSPVGEGKISTILSVPDEDCIFTACDGSNQIQQLHISEDDIDLDSNNNSDNTKPAFQTPLAHSEEIHNDAIVALKLVQYYESSLLLSVSADGVMALWDIPKGDLLFHCQISIEEILSEPEEEQPQDSSSFSNNFDNTESAAAAAAAAGENQPPRLVLCADSDANHIFLGTASGHVLGYDVTDLLMSASSGGTCPLPQGKFKAHDGGAVTAIACGGPGSLGRLGGASGAGSSSDGKTSSAVLLTGGMDGIVKQWEILSSPSMQKMENWPKISTQRLPKKAHIFEGHNGPITALESMGGRKPQFLSASEDGTIRAWDVAKGTEHYRMDGFTRELSSLCLLGSSDSGDDFLVTNGMNQYVCVHDFSQGIAGESVDDFLDPWDGES